MPAAAIKSYAEKSGHSVAEVEKYWDAAKESANEAWKGKKKDSHYWAYVNGIVKKRCKITESTSFKEFMEFSFDSPEQVMVPEPSPSPAPTEAPSVAPETVPAAVTEPTCSIECENFGRFISCLFAARDKTHELHLSTRSYAQHVALNELYDLLLDHADKMSESFQGRHGIIPICIPEARIWNQPCAYTFTSALVEWLNLAAKPLVGDDSYVINQFEELVGDVYRIKYKLDTLS